MRILVVEDERDLNRILTKTLTAEGCSVDACFDGLEALDYLSGASYDVIVLDRMMPRMDGMELLSRLRSQGDETPVIFLTAKDAVSERVRGLDAGADDYLVKPFSFEELMARIRDYAERFYLSNGRSPSTAEIGAAVGVHKATVYRYLSEMNEKGLLRYDGRRVSTKKTALAQTGMTVASVFRGAIPCGAPETVEAAIDQFVRLPTALFGDGKATSTMKTSYVNVIALYVPPAKSGQKITAVGSERQPVKVEAL